MKKIVKFTLALSIILLSSACKKEKTEAPLSEASPETEVSSEVEEPVAERELPPNNFEYYIVNSPEGIKVRDKPDLTSNRIAGLSDKTLVKLLQEGPEVTIDDITAKWLEIELPPQIAEKENVKRGWVFGGYMIKNPQDSVPEEYFNTYSLSNTGIAAVGSYIRAYKESSMYSAPSEKSKVISSFGGSDLGIILRGCNDQTIGDAYWYYILNQSNGKKGWILSKANCKSTANGYEISDTKKFYLRKNADVLVEEIQSEDKSFRNFSNLVLCADNIHFVTRIDEGKILQILDRIKFEKKNVPLYNYIDTYNGRDSNAICYSAKSNSVYFGWNDSLYSYSMDKDEVNLVFKIDTDAPEALSHSVAIQEISISKDENFIFLLTQFFNGRRYICRMIAYNAETKTQKIIDSVLPQCDSDHYYNYGPVDFDENNNAIYNIIDNRWEPGYGRDITEYAFVTVSSEAENWPNPVVWLLPDSHMPDKVVYLPESNGILSIDERFCVYNFEETEKKPQLTLKNSYRFAENSIWSSLNTYNNFQFNNDKTICAVQEGCNIAFYSTKTCNLLFALPVSETDKGYYYFWWNGKMLLVSTETENDCSLTSYNIEIKEKDSQISDHEPLNKEQVGLCAKNFRCEEVDDGLGYNFSFSPDGYYICNSFFADAEEEMPFKGVIGGYEITGDNSVHLYPYFTEIRAFYASDYDYSDFGKFNLLPKQEGYDLYVKQLCSSYNRFGDIHLLENPESWNSSIASTYDWGNTHGNYGVHYEKASSAYEIGK